MIQRFRSCGVVLLGVAIAAGWGCSRKPSRVYPPGINASSAGKEAMAQYDTDGDGVVKGEELDKAPSLKAAIQNLDKNGDGGVSAEEVTARVEAWQESRIGRMSLGCVVRHNGSPLSGAEVTYEPEKFLGEEIKASVGTSDENGVVSLTIPESDPPGAACGLYLVRISKKEGGQETIPAKYNTETTLGAEAAQDAAGIEEGVTYDLQY